MKQVAIDEEMLNRFLKGDSRCPIKIGDKIEKIAVDDEKDIHAIGSLGKVIGSYHFQGKSMYLVKWKDDKKVSFCADIKLRKF